MFPPRGLPRQLVLRLHRLDRSRSPGVRHSDVPPLPPPLLPGQDRIPGVAFGGTLTQARKPAWRFTFVRCCGSLRASISHGLTAKPGRQPRSPTLIRATAFRSWLPPIGPIKDFHLQSLRHARRTSISTAKPTPLPNPYSHNTWIKNGGIPTARPCTTS